MKELERKIVEEVKKNFIKVYTNGNNNQEVDKMIRLLDIKEQGHYLDLGTGSGYVAFRLADVNDSIFVDGLDVVDSMIDRNNSVAQKEQRKNMHFFCYEGVEFPMRDKKYDGLIARYTLHHFPNIEKTIQEMDRVLKEKSRIVICDCIRTEMDIDGFIDKWMKLLGDGHVSFVDVEKYCEMLGKYGFQLIARYDITIKCPRIMDEKYQFLLTRYNQEAKSYQYTIEKDTIWLTEPVAILCFERV